MKYVEYYAYNSCHADSCHGYVLVHSSASRSVIRALLRSYGVNVDYYHHLDLFVGDIPCA